MAKIVKGCDGRVIKDKSQTYGRVAVAKAAVEKLKERVLSD